MSRRVLITGAASGIGRATALRLAARGDRLVLWDMSSDALAAVAKEAGDAATAVVDVTDRDAVAAEVRHAGKVGAEPPAQRHQRGHLAGQQRDEAEAEGRDKAPGLGDRRGSRCAQSCAVMGSG